MPDRSLTVVVFIALGAAVLTLTLGAAALVLPLLGTLALVYFALTTPPRTPRPPPGPSSGARRPGR